MSYSICSQIFTLIYWSVLRSNKLQFLWPNTAIEVWLELISLICLGNLTSRIFLGPDDKTNQYYSWLFFDFVFQNNCAILKKSFFFYFNFLKSFEFWFGPGWNFYFRAQSCIICFNILAKNLRHSWYFSHEKANKIKKSKAFWNLLNRDHKFKTYSSWILVQFGGKWIFHINNLDLIGSL